MQAGRIVCARVGTNPAAWSALGGGASPHSRRRSRESPFGVLGGSWSLAALSPSSRHAAVGSGWPLGSGTAARRMEDSVVCGRRAPRFRDRLVACGLPRRARATAERRTPEGSPAWPASRGSAGRPSRGRGGGCAVRSGGLQCGGNPPRTGPGGAGLGSRRGCKGRK